MLKRFRSLLITLLVLLALAAGWYAQRPAPSPAVPAFKHSYSRALIVSAP